MVIITILILAGILGLVIAYITKPLVNPNEDISLNPNQSSDLLQAEYKLLLNRIRELEQDLTEGKISREDYQDHREKLNDQAADCLQQLDELSVQGK